MHVIGNTPWYISIGIFSHQLQNQTFLYLSHLEKEFKKLVALKKRSFHGFIYQITVFFFFEETIIHYLCPFIKKISFVRVNESGIYYFTRTTSNAKST
jgi:uncharacterized membrane protein